MLVSAGIINEQANLDLDYKEDANAQVDANFVICESGKLQKYKQQGKNIFLVESNLINFLN